MEGEERKREEENRAVSTYLFLLLGQQTRPADAVRN